MGGPGDGRTWGQEDLPSAPPTPPGPCSCWAAAERAAIQEQLALTEGDVVCVPDVECTVHVCGKQARAVPAPECPPVPPVPLPQGTRGAPCRCGDSQQRCFVLSS